MRIVFICGSLEPGRDGVGDYTRNLAGELIQLGHQAAVVALYDPHIKESLAGTQPIRGILLPVLRMPSVMDASNRFKRIREWIEKFEPEWLSIQFVPYAFHPKGFPFLLGKQLKRLKINGRHFHIMFHETWVGTEKRLNWKRLTTRALQKISIKQIISSLRPVVIHTQLPKTYYDLEKIMPEIKELPLFSNIAVTLNPQKPREEILRIGMFSQAEASEPIIKFLTTLEKNAQERHIQLELLLIGGQREHMKSVGNILEKIGNLKDHVSYTGFLSSDSISMAIQSCSVGITVVPRHALGKSGSVAAFISHGIPVAAPIIHDFRDPLEIGFFSPVMRSAILLEPDFNCLAKAREATISARNEIQLSAIAKTFISHLQHSYEW